MKIQPPRGFHWQQRDGANQHSGKGAASPKSVKSCLGAVMLAVLSLLLIRVDVFAQLPTPTYGWNLGNTLEATCGEGCWGPPASQALINGVANAGFNTVRIPCAWDTHANQQTYQIDPTYMARVKQIVDWCYARNLRVVINCHWDGGWLENNITDTVNATINAKMNAYWTQIANTFAGYDSRLVFAGANEPNCDTAAEWNTLKAYYNTFINAVRSTGGNNSSRWLVVQGPNTDIDLTDSLVTSLPTDPTPGRLMVEVHYYSPYQFTLMSSDQSWGNMFYFWGQGYHSTTLPGRNANWGEEDYLEAEFLKMYNKFTSQGIPVIIGEFGAYKRGNLTGADFNLNYASTTYYNKYVTDTANALGIKPIFWNTPGYILDWTTGAVTDQNTITALTGGPALPPPAQCTPAQTSVGALVTVVTGNGKNKRGQATITVKDNCGNPVANATVTGNFSGTFNENNRTGVTGSNGTVTITTNGKTGGNPSVTFCVSNITKSGLTYNPSANVVTCDAN